MKKKIVHKHISTRSKMSAGPTISSTGVLNNVLGEGKRVTQMPVKFANHDTPYVPSRKNPSKNNAPDTTSFYNHERAPASLHHSTTDNRHIGKILPLSQTSSVEPDSADPLSTNIDDSQTAGAGTAVPIGLPEEQVTGGAAAASSPPSMTDNGPAESGTTGDNDNCPICKVDVLEENSVNCKMCRSWVHQACLHMSNVEFEALNKSGDNVEWFCARCRQIKSNNIKWGHCTGEENIRNLITSTYETIIGWKKNTFRLPRGKCGTDFIKELTRLINPVRGQD